MSIDIVNLALLRKEEYNLSNKFIRHLKFLGAKTQEERSEIAKGDESLMQIDEWLQEYTSISGVKDAFDDRMWNKRISKEQGRIESKIDMARKMLAKNKPIEEIIEFTELTKEEIENLK